MAFRHIYHGLAPLAALAAALGLAAASAQAATHTSAGHPARVAATGTKIIVADGPFGPSLAVGSGPLKNHTLYFLSSDKPPSYGCTTGVTQTPVGPITCTGPSTDTKAEWPAITTVGKPVAGAGVNAKLLGTVKRKGVGDQITYMGYPLYLFAFDGEPFAVNGEGAFEPGLPPWHGIWWLMSPDGYPVPWAGTLTSATVGGKQVLVAQYFTVLGWINFPVYTFSADKPGKAVCSAIAACARAWPPMLTATRPGAIGVPVSDIGGLTIPGNLDQVSWTHKPLYLFAFEAIKLVHGKPEPQGNGKGVSGFGGTFHLVVNP
jgi:predicted lipoprotein with Yx(FWY)xxD motif